MIDTVQLWFLLGGLAAGALLGWLLNQLRLSARLQTETAAQQQELSRVQNQLEQASIRLKEANEQVVRQEQKIIELTQRCNKSELELATAAEQIEQKKQLQTRIEQQEQRLLELQDNLRHEHAIAADLKARLEASQQETTEKVALLREAKEQMKLEFQSIAQQLLEEKSAKFTLQNKTHLGELLTPLREQLGDFKKKVEDVYDKESRDRVSLLQEILSLKELNTKMSADAINLTRALKGDAKAQGNWGEMVLERVLEASGLQRGREYETQGSFINEAGQHLRPDVVVRLPEDKQIIIDSKVSLTAWERYCSSDEDIAPDIHLKAHIESLKTHIKQLSGKNYPDLYGINTPDFVLMFIPVEPAFLKALEVDSDLFSHAFDRNIMLVCPSTLLVTLKTIHSIWRFEYQNRNALEIATQAGLMHDQFVLFLESLDDVGDKLGKAQIAFDTAKKRLSTGRGNIIRRVHQLEVLGAKAKKKMGEPLLEEALGAEDENEH